MTTLSYTKKIVLSALCMALCVILPMVFHAIPDGGKIFCPMHLPALLCGLVCGPWFGLACGLFGSLLSSLMTGMPPMGAMAGRMMLELSVYGLSAGLLMKAVRTKSLCLDLYISLICASFLGKVIAGLVTALFFSKGGYSLAVWATGYFVTTLPGTVLQLVLIPPLVIALEKAKVIPKKYD